MQSRRALKPATGPLACRPNSARGSRDRRNGSSAHRSTAPASSGESSIAWTDTRRPPGWVTVASPGGPEIGKAGLAEACLNEPGTIELEHGERDDPEPARPPTADRQEHVRRTRRDPDRDHPAYERVDRPEEPSHHPVPKTQLGGGRKMIGSHEAVPRRTIASLVERGTEPEASAGGCCHTKYEPMPSQMTIPNRTTT